MNYLQNFLQKITKKNKVVGRGLGGRGKTCGRGTKGQKARKSGHTRPGFEGGQTPIYRRLPKVGFNHRKIDFQLINLGELEKNQTIKSGQVLDFSQNKKPVKILAGKNFTKKLIIKAQAFSQSAQKKIGKVGGEIHKVV